MFVVKCREDNNLFWQRKGEKGIKLRMALFPENFVSQGRQIGCIVSHEIYRAIKIQRESVWEGLSSTHFFAWLIK